MYKTGTNYDSFEPRLVECLLNKETTKKIDNPTLVAALAISKALHAARKTRFEINVADKKISPEEKNKAADLEKRIGNYVQNLEDIFKRMGISDQEGSALLFTIQD